MLEYKQLIRCNSFRWAAKGLGHTYTCMHAQLLQLCPTLQSQWLLHLWDSPCKNTGMIDMPSSRASSWSSDWTHSPVSPALQTDSLLLSHWGSPTTRIHVSILPQTLLPSSLPYNIEQSSLCYTVGHCWLSILNIAGCTCQFYPLYLFIPCHPPAPPAYPSDRRFII